MDEKIIILDFGGQYKELIARRVRELSVYCEILRGDISAEKIYNLSPKGIILTGGAGSVNSPNSQKCDPEIFNLGIPILGICYGMQLICYMEGGKVQTANFCEYGQTVISPCLDSPLFDNLPFTALMSHTDVVTSLPKGFCETAFSSSGIAAIQDTKRKIYGVQFHPEITHKESENEVIKRFLYDICIVSGNYKLDDYLKKQISNIRREVGKKRVLLGLSGGVDSSVCAALLAKAIPSQTVCVFVDHGLMRQNEGDEIEKIFKNFNLKFIRVNVKERFLFALKGINDPETKRKIIGREFARVFEEEAEKQGGIDFLAQGTIYPDIIESGGYFADGSAKCSVRKGDLSELESGGYSNNTAVIKSHHNVGGLPSNLIFSGVLEPLSGLFKDEVRVLGKKLKLPGYLVNRQPFPGPGLAVRIIGEITSEKVNILSQADKIMREEIKKKLNLKKRPSQYFAVLTNTSSVGVKGDSRFYGAVLALRAVDTDDFMTAQYSRISHKMLSHIAERIISEIPEISRVVYDITAKPPGTIEWE